MVISQSLETLGDLWNDQISLLNTQFITYFTTNIPEC